MRDETCGSLQELHVLQQRMDKESAAFVDHKVLTCKTGLEELLPVIWLSFASHSRTIPWPVQQLAHLQNTSKRNPSSEQTRSGEAKDAIDSCKRSIEVTVEMKLTGSLLEVVDLLHMHLNKAQITFDILQRSSDFLRRSEWGFDDARGIRQPF